MKNVTISLEDETMAALRQYARDRGMSLNEFLRDLVNRTVLRPSGKTATELFALMDQAHPSPVKIDWKREDLCRG